MRRYQYELDGSVTCLALLIFSLTFSSSVTPQDTTPPKSVKPATSAVEKMRKEHDKIEGVTWYHDKTTPKFTNRNNVYLYIGQKGAQVWLRLRLQYASDSWLFIERYLVVADGQKFDRRARFSRDHYTTIWEWYDGNVTKPDLEMVRAVMNSKETTIRYYGSQYRADRTVSAQEKQALKNVLAAYAALGGREP